MAAFRTKPLATHRLPPGIPFIIGNEAAERFSFYGMRAILFIFMTTYLHWMGRDPNAIPMGEAEAREYYHSFTAWVYLTPVLGAFLSDALLGKYPTIIWLSLVYCLGHLALALMGMPPFEPKMWMLIGLGLIALGSGGIKPCVSAHVGDQFGKSNRHLLPKVYSWFYFSINTGSFISTWLTPVLLYRLGPHWAFGVPGVLMAMATLLFWLGRYRYAHVPPGGERFLEETFSRRGLGTILRLSIIYAFIAVFWSLFDQTGSSWVQQAVDLDREILGVKLLPSQIQAANPIMVMVLIPIFSYGIYPLIERVFRLTEIRKISLGLFVMIGGFAVVAMLQELIDQGGRPSIGWQILAYLILTSAEVMVSITALEFAYTQAPPTMKSVMMILYLLPVALGNFITMGVNAFIQVPSQVATAQHAHELWYDPTDPESQRPTPKQIEQIERVTDVYGRRIRWEPGEPGGSYSYLLAGTDGNFGTQDDIRVVYSDRGLRQGVVTSDNDVLSEAETRVLEIWKATGHLPHTDEGSEVVGRFVDSYGQPLDYLLLNAETFRLLSLGADGEALTSDDVVLMGSVPQEAAAVREENDPDSWLFRRRQAVAAAPQASDASGTEPDEPTDARSRIAVGGHVKLVGASYFWFFTGMMGVTAVLFSIVGATYKPREYLQEEEPTGPEESADPAPLDGEGA